MKVEYNLSTMKSRKNPYGGKFQKSSIMCISDDVIDSSKKIVEEAEISYQNGTTIIAAFTTLGSVAFTYNFTESVRTQISKQTLDLEVIKVEVLQATQRTADTVALIDAARLELERQVASIDGARLDLQREIALFSALNETKRTDIDDQRRKDDNRRKFLKAQGELIPVVNIKCTAEKYHSRLTKLTCSFKNTGTHRIIISPVEFNLADSINQRVVEQGVASVENAVSNTLPVSAEGSNTYDFYLSEIGERLKNQAYRVRLKVQTDPVVVDKLREISKGYISKKDLVSLPIQYYTWDVNMK